jgi:hypothetical protein
MKSERRKRLDDSRLIKGVIETFLSNQKVNTDVIFVEDHSGIYGDSTVSVVVLNAEMIKSQVDNSELWNDLTQLIHLMGYTYITEEDGTHLRIIQHRTKIRTN